mgnify:CR=1 FL=1
MAKKLGFAVIGCREVSQIAWLPLLKTCTQAELIGVFDTSRELAKSTAEEYSTNFYSELSELLKDPKVDAVVVASPLEVRKEHAIMALEEEKNVVVEVPVAATYSEALEIARVAEKKGRKLMSAYMLRYDTGCRYVKRILEGQKITLFKQFYVAGSSGLKLCRESLSERLFAEEFKVPIELEEEAEQFYERLLGAWSHYINLMRWYAGEPSGVKYVEVWNRGNSFMVSFEYSSFKHIAVFSRVEGRNFSAGATIYTDDYWISVNTPPLLEKATYSTVEIYDSKKEVTWRPRLPREWCYERGLLHFIEMTREDRDYETGANDTLQDIYWIERVFKRYLEVSLKSQNII